MDCRFGVIIPAAMPSAISGYMTWVYCKSSCVNYLPLDSNHTAAMYKYKASASRIGNSRGIVLKPAFRKLARMPHINPATPSAPKPTNE